MIETLKLVGCIAGLATAAFTVWDRFVRGRPLVYLVAKTNGDAYHYLRVKNVSSVGILITGITASGTGLAKDHSINAIVRGAARHAPAAILDPDGEHDFVLL